ncbi:MAG: hypothetical protein ACK5HR_07450 [Mycoplasmatales bacterium]
MKHKTKKKIFSIILTIVLFLIIFFMIFGNRINFPFILSKVGINLATNTEEGEGCPKNLTVGYYDINSSNNTNVYNGITVGKGSTFSNIPSSEIGSVAVCTGSLSFTSTNLKEIDFSGQTSFDINPGKYTIGENIDPGKYKLTTSLKKMKIYIQIMVIQILEILLI